MLFRRSDRPDNFFDLPLWTDWRTGINPGILDWYTAISGLMALLASSCTELYICRSKPKAISNAAPEPGPDADGPSSPWPHTRHPCNCSWATGLTA